MKICCCCLCCVQLQAAAVARGGLLGPAGVDAKGGQAFMEVNVARVGLSVARARGEGKRREGEREGSDGVGIQAYKTRRPPKGGVANCDCC